MLTVRVFSLVRKIQTEFKADIQNDAQCFISKQNAGKSNQLVL